MVFGPDYASDIPEDLVAGKQTEAMRQVRFALRDRLEMASVWALLVSVIGAVILAIGWHKSILPFVAMTWVLTLGLYLFFPWFSGHGEC